MVDRWNRGEVWVLRQLGQRLGLDLEKRVVSGHQLMKCVGCVSVFSPFSVRLWPQ